MASATPQKYSRRYTVSVSRDARLGDAERETVIMWSDADAGLATVFTAQRAMATRLRRLRRAVRTETSRGPRGEWWGETWQVPAACVVLRSPSRRMLTEAQKQAVAERGRLALVSARRVKVARNSTSMTLVSGLQSAGE